MSAIQTGLAGMLSQCRDVGLVGKYRKQVAMYGFIVVLDHLGI